LRNSIVEKRTRIDIADERSKDAKAERDKYEGV